jgi:hypothetical protein
MKWENNLNLFILSPKYSNKQNLLFTILNNINDIYTIKFDIDNLIINNINETINITDKESILLMFKNSLIEIEENGRTLCTCEGGVSIRNKLTDFISKTLPNHISKYLVYTRFLNTTRNEYVYLFHSIFNEKESVKKSRIRDKNVIRDILSFLPCFIELTDSNINKYPDVEGDIRFDSYPPLLLNYKKKYL